MRSWIRVSVLAPCALVTAYQSANAQQIAVTAPVAPAATSGAAAATTQGDLDEIVVNGIKRGDLILPTQVTSGSAYGLDLNVMDTPRNNTLLSKAQLDALNIQNPGGFSYLTSSSYSDAAFGQPNVPRIRGQYADLFFNGMRDSFTLNGYGAPISFNSVDSVDIVKGPASVQGGPGAGVGGSIDITTKMPSLTKLQGSYQVEFDTQQKRRASFDVNDPLSATTAVRVSFATDDSGSYYNNMYFHQQSFFISALSQVTDKFSVLTTAGFEDTRYRENDGINHVNQAFIDDGAYLTGGATDPSTISGFGTQVTLGNPRQVSDRITIDEPGGNGAHSVHAKGQLILTYQATDNFAITNNTFYDYINRYNQVMAYYADTAKGSYTIENKTDFKVKFGLGGIANDVDAGFTYRYAHVLDIQNYANEPVSVFDLSTSPSTFVFPASAQLYGGAIPYTAAFGHVQYGVPGAYGAYANGTIDSNLQDAAIFLEHRITFSPQWSVLYGVRGDVVQLDDSDPLYDAGLAAGLGPYDGCTPPGGYCIDYPESQHTAWYGLYNGNVSVVYSPSEHISTYLTYNKAQYVDANANDGAVGTLGVDPTTQLRQKTLLEEVGLKFDLLDKRLFISTALFKQERAVPVGVGGLTQSLAHIKGAEIEMNYQPDPHFFATASYSYLHTMLDSPSSFWDFPAQAGTNYDGAGTLAVYNSNQRFLDPGVPQHLFNVLANWKHESGFGAQGNIQVTGPLDTTQSGYLNVAATNAGASFLTPALVGPGGLISSSVVSANGYYKSPQIPWQYTINVAAFYTYQEKYTIKFSIYNLTSRQNLTNDYPFYGNDFLTRDPPRSYDLTLSGKF